MSVASVAQDFAGQWGLSWRPSDPVTLRNVSGLSGPGLCWATGTFPKAQWPGHPVKCQWPQWPGTLPGRRDFPERPVTLRNVSGLSGLGLCWATETFPTTRQSPKFDKTDDCCHPLYCDPWLVGRSHTYSWTMFVLHMRFKRHKMGIKLNILSILLHPSQFVYNYILSNS